MDTNNLSKELNFTKKIELKNVYFKYSNGDQKYLKNLILR